MHVQTHILSGWCIANLLPCTPRQRLAAMVAATASDLDGLPIVYSVDAYQRVHHTFGHNVYFAVAVGLIAAAWARPAIGTFVLCAALVHLHLFLDYWGSGPDWHIHYLWPSYAWTWRNPRAWELYSWQNLTAFFALLAWTVAIAGRAGRTPLELLMPRLDRELVDGLRRLPRRWHR
jgi:inner membrane protein